MSQIEEKAKPVLTPLLKGEQCALDHEKIETLGHWIALKTIVGELDDPDSAAITDKERQAFFRNRTMPRNFRARIGKYIGPTGYRHRPLSLYIGYEDVAPAVDPFPHGQSTTIVAGELSIHTFSADDKLAYLLVPLNETDTLRHVIRRQVKQLNGRQSRSCSGTRRMKLPAYTKGYCSGSMSV
jgi:hypothetical protein